MTLAQRKAVPGRDGIGRVFYTDTPQDAAAGSDFIDLGQGFVTSPGPGVPVTGDTGDTGDNVNAPITFAVDAVFTPPGTTYAWTLSDGRRTVTVPTDLYDARRPYLRLLPRTIFSMLDQPLATPQNRTALVTAVARGKPCQCASRHLHAGDVRDDARVR